MKAPDRMMALILGSSAPRYGYRYVRLFGGMSHWRLGEFQTGTKAGLCWFPAFNRWRVHIILPNGNRKYYTFKAADKAAEFAIRKVWPRRHR